MGTKSIYLRVGWSTVHVHSQNGTCITKPFFICLEIQQYNTLTTLLDKRNQRACSSAIRDGEITPT